MTRMNRGAWIASILTLIAITASACTMPYSQAPVATITPGPQFATPLPNDPMQVLQSQATGTKMAELGTQVVNTPTAFNASPTPTKNQNIQQAPTATPQIVVATTAAPTNTVTVATATLAIAPSNNTGNTGGYNNPYTLQAGEFPFCIARRFNVDPNELLALNGITNADVYYVGQVLKIPQSGNPFPSDRMLHHHPDTYTVDSPTETINGIACYYGDIDPARIAQANNLPLTATLSVGQQLTIP